MKELKVGSKAPAFSLLDDSDEKVTLKDFAGKPLVLYFYPKDMTSGCTQEACDFQDSLAKLTKLGAHVVGVSKDSVESHQKFKTKQGLKFQLLSDPDGKMCEAYGVWKEKSLYGRKFMGIVRTTFLIDGSGKITHIYPKVKISGHVEDVIRNLS